MHSRSATGCHAPVHVPLAVQMHPCARSQCDCVTSREAPVRTPGQQMHSRLVSPLHYGTGSACVTSSGHERRAQEQHGFGCDPVGGAPYLQADLTGSP